jgi:FkbM family methyltransferase
MPVSQAAKVLVRSRSVAFTRDYLTRAVDTGRLGEYTWRGHRIHYRAGSSDTVLIYRILLKCGNKGEYCPPGEFEQTWDSVRVVLDFGANIGISAIYFASIFPNAVIHAFEPEPGNFELLAKNTAGCGRIRRHPFALGGQDGEITLFESSDRANLGGFTAHPHRTADCQGGKPVAMRHAGRFLAELGITSADVIKIDTEGAEWDILTACDPALISSARLILGELHGRRDFALLDYLQGTFHIGLSKGIKKRLFNFCAVNRGPPG